MTTTTQLLQIHCTPDSATLEPLQLSAEAVETLQQGATLAVTVQRPQQQLTVLYRASGDHHRKPEQLIVLENTATDGGFLRPLAQLPLPVDIESEQGPLVQLCVVYFAGQPWLIGYRQHGKFLLCYRLNDDCSVELLHRQYVGTGFDTLAPLNGRYDNSLMLYNSRTGQVMRYQLMVPPQQPLGAQRSWQSVWASNWRNFAFFRFGGEDFFLKTNTEHQLQNIDIFPGPLDKGAHPVLSEPASAEMLNAHRVVTFQNARGDAWYLVCQADGSCTTWSIHPSCRGRDALQQQGARLLACPAIVQAITLNAQPALLVLGSDQNDARQNG